MSAARAAAAGARLDDRINPILVKEVRQSLRGKYFRVLFWLTLGVGTLLGLSIVAGAAANDNTVELGQMFFMSIFGVLAAAVHGFVPFSAFLATSAEWDENTYDLLIISNLKPRQIVQGKLLSALIQALLYYSTFGPFLVFAFLMNGIDLGSVLVILAGSLATCLALTLVGIAASSLSAAKVGRVVIMALFGAGLVGVWGMTLGLAGAITFSPQLLRDIEGQTAVVLYLTAVGIVALAAHSIAVSRFAHEEENRSTSLRVISSLVVLAAGVWGAWLYAQFTDHEAVWGCQAGAALACFLPWLFFLTEPEELGRRVEVHLPKHPLLALCAAPFLPGGGRAVALVALQVALALAGGQLALLFAPTSVDERAEVATLTFVVFGYTFLYTGLPAGIAAFFVRRSAARALLRVLVVIAVPVSVLLPVLAGLFLQVPSWMQFEHPFNPVWVVYEVQADRGYARVAPFMLLLLSLLAVSINLPRAIAGLREVVRTRRTPEAEVPDAPSA